MIKGMEAFFVALVLGAVLWGLLVVAAGSAGNQTIKAIGDTQKAIAKVDGKSEAENACDVLAADRNYAANADLLGCAEWRQADNK